MAIENGFFDKRGIKVDAVPFETSPLMGTALVNNGVDAVASIESSVAFSLESREPGRFRIFIVDAEMSIGTQTGVGKVIDDMTYSDDRAAQYADVFYAGILGYALNTACEWLRKLALQRYDCGNVGYGAH